MREEPVDEGGAIAGFIDAARAGAFDLVVCLTGAGVRGLLEAAERLERRDELIAALTRLPVLCRGPKPVAALRGAGLSPSYTTPSPYTTAQVLEVATRIGLRGRRVGVVRHGGPSPELIDGLRALGTDVQDVQVYHWALPEDTHPIQGLIERLQAGAIDAVAFTS